MIQRVDHRRRRGRRSFACRCRPTSTARRCATTSRAGRRVGRRAVEPRRLARSRSSPRRAITSASSCASPTRPPARSATCSRRRSPTFFESGNGARQLALPAGVERSDLVLRARQLGPALSLRSADRQAEEPDHDRRRQRHAAAARRREERARSTSSASGKEKGRDPYFRHFYRDRHGRQEPAAADAGGRRSRRRRSRRRASTSSTATRSPTCRRSPCCATRTASWSLHAREGRHLAAASPTGWKPPMPITVKARDGETDLYGLMFKPTNLDPTKKYPIINHIYPGPQTGSVGSRSFIAGARRCAGARRARLRRRRDRRHGHAVALEEIPRGLLRQHGRQHAARSGRRHEGAGASAIRGSTSIAPASTATRAAASPPPTRCSAIPDFFKVGISEVGQSRQSRLRRRLGARSGRACWRRSRRHDQLRQPGQPELSRKNLKGKLLLAHGTMDNNVPPYNTLLVVDALIKANKDFDLLMLPNQRARLRQRADYMMRRRWDYFVKNLLGAEPPHEYELKPPARPTPRRSAI